MPHALQDVTDVLDDPDFYDDTLAYIRRAVEQQSNGSAIGWPGGTPFRGVVDPTNGQQLIQLPEGDQGQDTITIYTRLELDAGSGDTDADIVIWDDIPHRVIAARTFRFGQQFTVAICARIPLNPSVRPNARDDGFL